MLISSTSTVWEIRLKLWISSRALHVFHRSLSLGLYCCIAVSWSNADGLSDGVIFNNLRVSICEDLCAIRKVLLRHLCGHGWKIEASASFLLWAKEKYTRKFWANSIGKWLSAMKTRREKLTVNRPKRGRQFPGHLFEVHGAVRLPVNAFDNFPPSRKEPVIRYRWKSSWKCATGAASEREMNVCIRMYPDE